MSSPEANLKQADPQPDRQSDTQNVNPPGVTPSEAEALERLARLNQSLRARAIPEPLPVELPPSEPPTSRVRTFLRPGRIIKSLLALAAAVALLWIPVQRLLYTTSAQATINARLINLRAPIEGKVSVVAPAIAVGSEVKPGEPLLRLTNARASRERLDDLRRKINGLRSETKAQAKRIAQLTKVKAEVKAQRDAFQESRVRQLQSRAEELKAQIGAADAKRADAEKSVKRSKELIAKGGLTAATLLHAERDLKVAEMNVAAAHRRLESNKIELDGARKGLFVGDSYNDLPRSAQRLDEIDQKIVDLNSQLDERKTQLAYLEKELTAEKETFAHDTNAVVSATTHGRIWEVLTANGEEVSKGQDLMRILDCAGAVVTATVSESVYNKLWIGQPVEFKLHGDSQAYAGSVAGLTGLAAAGSNFAINQTALTREPYHATIAVPGLSAQNRCNIGRTGSVTFDASAQSGAGLAASAQRTMTAIRLGRAGHLMFDKVSAYAAGLVAAMKNAIENVKPRLGLS
jgi:multidrug resistance efflux pump